MRTPFFVKNVHEFDCSPGSAVFVRDGALVAFCTL